MALDKNAKELIQKLATLNPIKALKHHTHKAVAKGATGGLLVGTAAGAGAHHLASKKKDEKKEAQLELIQKLAVEKRALAPETVGRALVQRMARTAPSKAQGELGLSYEKEKLYQNNLNKRPAAEQDRAVDAAAKTAPKMFKQSSMKNIIDDLIKGAENNTFGRPVNIQTQTDFSPIDMAKVAGAVVALSEKGYSVKQAAEYLGLTEKQVADIVSTVG